LSELNETEWQEFEKLVDQLEDAYTKALGARPLNWGYFMNNAFRKEPAHPHVHWHLFPRYKNAPQVGGITFDDPLYGEHYDPNAEKIVSDEVVEKIIEKLKEHLSYE
jgi:diadenosine tetraphosphate (Ap4A) HIT family hydrolase